MPGDRRVFAEARRGQDSPILKAQSFALGMERLDDLQKLQTRVLVRQAAVDEQLAGLNAAWEAAPPPGDPARRAALPLDRLEQLYRASSFLARAGRQIQERTGLLAG